MRHALIEGLCEIAERDPRVVFITGDLGYTVVEPFAERFPDRFLNAGVAEQNMVGVATGLAEAGFVPFVYSIATFASMRPYEFIRNGPILHRLPVRVVGVGGGFDYGPNGLTHYALEDVALMRTQPRMTVVVPADAAQAGAAVRATWDLDGPLYLRLGKQNGSVPGLDGRFRLGRTEVLGEPGDVLFTALGPVAADAVQAAEMLRGEGVGASVAVVSSFNPSPADDLAEAIASAELVVSVEAHYRDGGLGSFVAETIAERGLGTRLVRAGVAATPTGDVGSQAYLHDVHGLSAAALAAQARSALAATS